MDLQGLNEEISRIKEQFSNADTQKMAALDALIEQAAYERLYLKQLNEQAMQSGLLKVHPDNPAIQQSLPVSKAIATHSASLTNIMDKLMKYLAVEQEDEDDELSEFE